MQRTASFLFFLCCLSLAFGLQAQQASLYRADKLYEIGNYPEALKNYLAVLEQGEGDALSYLRAGHSYLEIPGYDEKQKALPLLQKAVALADEKTPATLYLYLGDALYLNEKVHEAQEAYAKYRKLDEAGDKKAQDRLMRASYAQELLANPKAIQLKALANGVNSAQTEYNPVVTADESLMAYTVLQEGSSRSSAQPTEKIMLMKREGGNWGAPKALDLGKNFMAGTAGISADGQQLLVFLNAGSGDGNLYLMQRKGDSWGAPIELKGDVNSRYMESTASLTPDGKTIYFSSNRPGGFGGFDIYRARLQDNGVWGKAENLGAEVNSEADEEAPFIHPDGRSLFFTSNGKFSLGGTDIFRTNFIAGNWSKPENLGVPINSMANDSYFTLTADGSKAYFSSDRPGGQGGQDIYTFLMPEQDRNIPLTMIKGQILAGEDEQPVPTVIKVVDVSTGSKVDFVYNPDPETGNYLIILPPGRNYDMVVQAEGYLPYAININIPNQNYFYELYQRVYLRPVKQFDVMVGQEVQVKNAFYDTGKPLHHDLKKVKESNLVQQDSVDVYEMMETIISAGDTEAYEYLLDLMFTVNPIEEVDFAATNGENVETAETVYYYEENDKTKLEAKKVGDEVIYTLPTFYVAEAAKEPKLAGKKAYDPALLEGIHKIFFAADAKALKPSDEAMLKDLLEKFMEEEQLGVEISGYASEDGDEEYNRKLSNERAISVLDYLNKSGLARRRIVARGYGATQGQEGNAEDSRRVEVRIIDLSTAQR